MFKQRGIKLGLMATTGMLALALNASPARAHHGADIVVPVVTAFAIGALWSHGHSHHHYRHSYRYKRHGHYRHGYSRHGYSRKGHYRHGHGHHRHQYRSSSSRGGYHGSKRRH